MHKRVAVKNLQKSLPLPKLSKYGYFTLQLSNSCVIIPEAQWGLKEEGNSREPAVRSNVQGLFSECVESERWLRAQLLRPGREVSITDCNNSTDNQRLTFWSEY